MIFMFKKKYLSYLNVYDNGIDTSKRNMEGDILL